MCSKIYRTRAAALAKQAKSASAPIAKERFERMALAYERLAEKCAKRPPLYNKENPSGVGPSKTWLKIKNPKAPGRHSRC
jgi:hypothetical protein